MNFKKAGILSVVGLTTMMAAGLATNVMADDHKGGHEGYGKHGKMEMRDPAKMADRLSKHLELDEATTAKVAALFEAQSDKREALHAEHKAALEALLTPEQITKLEAMQERGGKHGKKGKGHMNDDN